MPASAETIEAFKHKTAADPEGQAGLLVDGIHRIESRAIYERDQVVRNGSLEQIKYAQGRLDGVHETLRLIETMSAKEAGKPGIESPLASRIFSLLGGRNDGR